MGTIRRRAQAPPAFEPVKTARAFEEVAAQVRRRVMNGYLKPGDRLPSERDLATRLGVSRNTVREGLRALEIGGVLKLQKGAHGGAFIVPPTGEAMQRALHDMYQLGTITPEHLTEARFWIEDIVVRIACERWRDDDLVPLERNVEAAERASATDDLMLRAQINIEFHRLLARTTRNPILTAVVNGIMDVMWHFVSRVRTPVGRLVFPSRRRLIGHLQARDTEAATQEMTSILRTVQRALLAQVQPPPNRGSQARCHAERRDIVT